MIVIAQNLVVAPLAAEPLYLPCLGYDNVLTAGGIVASTTLTGYPASNMANPSTVDIWRGTGPSDIVGDVNPVHPVDFIAFARHNFGSAQIPILIQGRTSGSLPEENWFQIITQHILADDSPVIYRFVPTALQDIRVRLLAGGTAAPEAAVMYCGKLMTFQRGTQGGYTPLTDARTAEIMTGQSEDGNYLGRIITGARTQSQASFIGLDPAWCRSQLRPFLDASLTSPFFFAWSPIAYPQEAGYAWLGTPANVSYDLENYGNIDLDMVGIVK